MRRDILIGILVSVFLHGGLGLGSRFWPEPAPATPPPPPPPIEVLLAPPPPEPETVDTREYTMDDAGGGASDVAAPQLADTPVALIESPFIQRLQPPPPPGLPVSAGLVTIPKLSGSGGGVGTGFGNLFDLAALDQPPVPTFQPSPIYPYEMTRAGLSGEVLLEFVIDSNGRVRDARVVRSSDRRFEAAALQAVNRWRFRPGVKNGVAVNTRRQLPIIFNLESGR